MRRLKYLILLLGFFNVVYATQQVNLIGIETTSLPGNRAQFMLEFSGPPPTPNGFSMDNPATMIFDFPQVASSLSKQNSSQKLVVGVVSGLNVVESVSRTRLIVKVQNIVPYTIDFDRNKIIITLDNALMPFQEETNAYTISALDFRRGEAGEGRLIIDFTNDTVPVDFAEESGKMTVTFRGATIPEKLLRKFDVTDFGTNMQKINVERVKDDVVMQIITTGDYEKVAYQLDKQYIVQVRSVEAGALQELIAQKFKFTGQRISLNFQNIPIRSVLQLIADFANLNIVVNDSVQGNVTLRLENIPWDEALSYILQSKGLIQRSSGNIILIGPSDEMYAREQSELEAQQQVQALAPLESEFIQVNYAKAADMVTMIKATGNNLLSSRGQISVDTRTNTLLVKDTAQNIANIKDLVSRLDIPVRQVMIEAQIIETTDSLTDAFGLQMTGAATAQLGKYVLGVGPNMALAQQFAQNPSSKSVTPPTSSTGTSSSTTSSSTSSSTSSTSNLFFDFSDAAAKGILGLSLAKLPGGILLDLELQASELETKTKTIARPKLVTQDQQKASIETGQEIPYTTTAQAGSTPTTTFKKAVLKLEVTPQITPNNKISMNLSLSDDSPTTTTFDGQVGINTTSMNTNILVDDGETVVLGGIFKTNAGATTQYIPYLSKIPIIGGLFRSSDKTFSRDEILIFITPRVVKNIVS